jgi:hypothetical protein
MFCYWTAYNIFGERCGYVDIIFLGCKRHTHVTVGRYQRFVEMYCHYPLRLKVKSLSVQIFGVEVGDTSPWNVSIYLQICTASQSKRTTPKSSPLLEPHISQRYDLRFT